jgi:hypothetical protein
MSERETDMRALGFVTTAVVALAVQSASVAPAWSAQDAEIIGATTNVLNCTVDIVFRVEDAGDYFVTMFDDGNFRGGAGGPVPAGGTSRVRVTIGGPILQGAAGIGVYVQDNGTNDADETYDADGSFQGWSDQLATRCTGLGNTFQFSVVSEEFPTGSKLTLTSSSGGKPRKLSLLAKDPRIAIGRGPTTPDDPVLNGGSLRVVAEGGTLFDDTYPLDAAGWKYRSAGNPAQGYVFSGEGAIQKVLVKPGGQIKISGKSESFGHELTQSPVAVRVELRIGERRFCFRFGGLTTFAQDQSFTAVKASADELSCPD